ncbi:MAG: DUF342 domain-containing protein [Thermovirgaceae bacterium]
MEDTERGYELQKTESGWFVKGLLREENIDEFLKTLREKGASPCDEKVRELTGRDLSDWIPVPVEEEACPVEVRISSDKMTAEVLLSNGEKDPPEKRFEQAKAALEKAGVTTGVDEAILKEAVAERRDEWVPVAFGTPVKDGVDAWFDVLVDLTQHGPSGSESENGHVDHRDLRIINNVTKGQELVRKTPAVEGEDGVDVTGKILRAKRPKDTRIVSGSYTSLSEDGLVLVATEDGHLEREGNKFSVYPVYEHKGDVDYSSGNLEAVGGIVVHGSVKEDFSVSAGKTLEVHGVVERAFLSSGKDMTLTSSARGMNHGTLKSGGSILAEYVDQCFIKAAKDVIFRRALMHCDVEAGLAVRHTEGGKGLIAGGTVKAGSEVECLILGSEMETRTVLHVGVSPGLLRKKEKLVANLDELEEKLGTIEKNLKYLTRVMKEKGLDERQKALALKFVELRKSVSTQIEKLKGVLGEIEKTIDAIKHKGCVKVWELCHPGVSVTIRGETYLVRETVERVRFIYKEGKVRMLSLD